MSTFATLSALFGANWTTVLVGWNGLGVLSPWPSRWVEFAPLLSSEEIVSYAHERLGRDLSIAERDLVLPLLNLSDTTREEVRKLLEPLSDLADGNPALELRKWRLVLLEQLLLDLPPEPTSALFTLTEFWQEFGFPADGPHEVQGLGNAASPFDYYQRRTLASTLARHRAWIDREKATLSAPL